MINNKIYDLFNRFDNAKDFSSYLMIEFLPISDDKTKLAFNVFYGESLKYYLYYAYQFYMLYDMDLIETLSIMADNIDIDDGYNRKNHIKNTQNLVLGLELWITDYCDGL